MHKEKLEPTGALIIVQMDFRADLVSENLKYFRNWQKANHEAEEEKQRVDMFEEKYSQLEAAMLSNSLQRSET